MIQYFFHKSSYLFSPLFLFAYSLNTIGCYWMSDVQILKSCFYLPTQNSKLTQDRTSKIDLFSCPADITVSDKIKPHTRAWGQGLVQLMKKVTERQRPGMEQATSSLDLRFQLEARISRCQALIKAIATSWFHSDF